MEQKKDDQVDMVPKMHLRQIQKREAQSSSMYPSNFLNVLNDQESLDDLVETEGKLSNGTFGEVFYGKIKSSKLPVVIKYNK